MKDELNYLSERIQELENRLEYYDIQLDKVLNRTIPILHNKIEKTNKELEHLNNILNYITLKELE